MPQGNRVFASWNEREIQLSYAHQQRARADIFLLKQTGNIAKYLFVYSKNQFRRLQCSTPTVYASSKICPLLTLQRRTCHAFLAGRRPIHTRATCVPWVRIAGEGFTLA